jgi:hypothetical protein
MQVELLWWEGCPSTDEALAELRAEMSALGLDPEGIQVREIDTEADAERHAFVGSPTVRVDGRDVQAPADEATGLTCRVYRLRDGRISAVPDREDVREALAKAMREARDERG